MATRIYQGRITSAEFKNINKYLNQKDALSSLNKTYSIFHDAVNYHLVALAGMASFGAVGIITEFYNQVRNLFDEPQDIDDNDNLKSSICRTLGISTKCCFENVISEIFKDVDNKEIILPHVLQYIIDKTKKGESVIQKKGRELLPKLCNSSFGGNFDFTIKEKKAIQGKLELQTELYRDDITDEELLLLAQKMDLSWAGIKTKPDEKHETSLCFPDNEVLDKVNQEMNDFCERLKEEKSEKLVQVLEVLKNTPLNKNLARNKKTPPELKQAAIFFMFYPCKLSAEFLRNKLGKVTAKKETYKDYDYTKLDHDPLVLARGGKGMIYRGYTALSIWETKDEEMLSKEFDILAFKEALKTLHGFVLKTEERKKEVENIQNKIDYLEFGKGTKKNLHDDIELPVLGGDPRFEALKELVKEITPDEETVYHLSNRTIQGFDDIRKEWLKLKQKGESDFNHLSEKVREIQATKKSFGSQPLFEALCHEKYHHIWLPFADGKFNRSENILKDFSIWQSLKEKKLQYERPVRISAAHPKKSPRQLMYSDLETNACRLKGNNKESIEVTVVVKNELGKLLFDHIALSFSAPRFERDEMGRDSSTWEKGLTWIQPMMKALNLSEYAQLNKKPAVALYIKYSENLEPKYYLNFPVTINLEKLHQDIEKAQLWKGQFNGPIEEKLHLHWQGTCKKWKVNPWWKDENISTNGFNVLGIDLGVRFAAAWSLINVQKYEENQNLPPQCRYIGTTEGEQWYGNIQKQGKIKIDGERSREVHGKIVDAVAYPSEYDLKLANKIFSQHGITKDYKNTSVLKLGNNAIACFKKMLSRTRTLQSYLSKLNKDNSEEHIAKHIKDIHEHFSYSEYIKGIIVACENQDLDKLKELLSSEILRLIKDLPTVAVDLTTLILPRKHGHWEWNEELKEGWQGSGEMVICEGEDTPRRNVYHRGGLSIARIEQLEKLRQSLQSMSKILSHEPGEEVPFGRQLRDLKTIDPCPSILEKIENMREQRVNVIAHEIVAQALGVRLRPSRPGKNANKRDVIHGEYEIIPGRKPVDLVVMENLSRYTTNNDRSKTENSTLMRWCHRQITAKIVQILEEVFGIPVLFTHAAYTSKFDSIYSTPGFRPEVMTEQALCYMKDHEKNETLKKKFEVYLSLVSELNNSKYKGKIYLLKPHYNNGGEMFLTEHNGEFILRDADLNASANIAWRGIAAPEALHLLHRVRLEIKKNKISPVYNNDRESALKGSWELKVNKTPGSKNLYISAFVKTDDSKNLAFAEYTNGEQSYLLSEGITLWKDLKDRHWDLCDQYNLKMLQKAGINTKELEKIISKKYDLPDDKLPM